MCGLSSWPVEKVKKYLGNKEYRGEEKLQLLSLLMAKGEKKYFGNELTQDKDGSNGIVMSPSDLCNSFSVINTSKVKRPVNKDKGQMEGYKEALGAYIVALNPEYQNMIRLHNYYRIRLEEAETIAHKNSVRGKDLANDINIIVKREIMPFALEYKLINKESELATVQQLKTWPMEKLQRLQEILEQHMERGGKTPYYILEAEVNQRMLTMMEQLIITTLKSIRDAYSTASVELPKDVNRTLADWLVDTANYRQPRFLIYHKTGNIWQYADPLKSGGVDIEEANNAQAQFRAMFGREINDILREKDTGDNPFLVITDQDVLKYLMRKGLRKTGENDNEYKKAVDKCQKALDNFQKVSAPLQAILSGQERLKALDLATADRSHILKVFEGIFEGYCVLFDYLGTGDVSMKFFRKDYPDSYIYELYKQTVALIADKIKTAGPNTEFTALVLREYQAPRGLKSIYAAYFYGMNNEFMANPDIKTALENKNAANTIGFFTERSKHYYFTMAEELWKDKIWDAKKADIRRPIDIKTLQTNYLAYKDYMYKALEDAKRAGDKDLFARIIGLAARRALFFGDNILVYGKDNPADAEPFPTKDPKKTPLLTRILDKGGISKDNWPELWLNLKCVKIVSGKENEIPPNDQQLYEKAKRSYYDMINRMVSPYLTEMDEDLKTKYPQYWSEIQLKMYASVGLWDKNPSNEKPGITRQSIIDMLSRAGEVGPNDNEKAAIDRELKSK
jgi:hypothetical protein